MLIQSQIEFKNIHSAAPQESELATLGVGWISRCTLASEILRSRATRGAWNSAAARDIQDPDPKLKW